MELSAIATSAQPVRWTETCPVCGYSLKGLPDVGICPECGERYDTSEIILYGWALGSHATISNGAKGRFPWLMCVTLFMTLLFSLQIGLRFLGVLVLVQLVLIAVSLARRRNNDHAGLVQVHLSDDGAVQYDNLEPSYAMSLAGSYLLMAGALGPLVVILLHYFGIADRLEGLLWCIVSVCFGPALWVAGRRLRQAGRLRAIGFPRSQAISYEAPSLATIGTLRADVAKRRLLDAQIGPPLGMVAPRLFDRPCETEMHLGPGRTAGRALIRMAVRRTNARTYWRGR
jgi:hypothetical protein